jgi:hypothetical protein
MPLTGELAQINDELCRVYDAAVWHGAPPLRQVLMGVSAELAATKHPKLVHSIWAIVNHLGAWVEVVAQRVTRQEMITGPEAGDFPSVINTSEASWQAALDHLDCQHRKLLDVLTGLDPERLAEIVPGKTYPFSVLLQGMALHYAYHAGQIALMKVLVA